MRDAFDEVGVEQIGFGLDVARIGQTTLDRADRLTRLVVVETDALGAQLGVDHVDRITLGDGFVGALRLAGAAVDAIGSDVSSHGGANAAQAFCPMSGQ